MALVSGSSLLPLLAKMFGARGVIHSSATDTGDRTEDPRFGRVGKQRIEDTGPLHQERMHDFEGAEVIPRALDFMKQSRDADQPFFVWLNTSRMHLYWSLCFTC